MIDGIKIVIGNKLKFEQNLLIDGILPISGGKTDYSTGETLEYPKGGNLNSLVYKITEKQAELAGSLHKFYNNVVRGENQNHDGFSFTKIQSAVRIFKKLFNFGGDVTLTNVEFGFNILIDNDPNEVVKYRVLMYNFRDHEQREEFESGEFSKEFRRTDYKWKIYKKRNLNNPSQNILRMEIKILLKRQLDKLGIYSVEDLVSQPGLQRLFEFFIEKFDDLMIVDNAKDSQMSNEQRNLLMRYTNVAYWNSFKENKISNKIRDNRRASAYRLISSLGLDSTKKSLKDKIVLSFSSLMTS